jgi:hypothetical protein
MVQVCESLLEIVKECSLLLGFHHHIIHICVYVSAYLLVQTSLHAALVSCAYIFEAERHSDIAVSVVRGDEGSP